MENFAFTKQQKLKQSLQMIKWKLDRKLPLTSEEHRLVCEVERLDKLKMRLHFKSEDGKFHITRTADVDPVFEHVRGLSQAHKDAPALKRKTKYLGSLDPITAAEFRKNVGAGVGTKEFQEYALKKINDTHTKFKADK